MLRNLGRPLALSLILVGLVGGHAAAGPVPSRSTRPPKVVPPRPERSRPRAPKPAPGPAAPLKADELIAIQRDTSLIRQQQIDLLETLAATTPAADVNDKARAYFLLAEAYAQLDRYHRLQAGEATMQADRATAAEKQRLTAEAATHTRAATSALANAIKSYKAIADDAALSSFADRDQALFYYAYSLRSAKYLKESRVIFHKLLTEHPQSPFAPEAYLAFADYYFGAGELDNAAAFYKKVILFPTSKVYSYANYMLGWVDLDQRRPEDAAYQFLQVIRDTDGQPTQSTQSTLNGAAKKDFVRAFAEFGQVDKALATFRKLDAGRAMSMYELLADLYALQGKSDRAVFAYRQLIAEEPRNAHVCLWEYDVAQALLSTPGVTAVQKVDEVVRLTELWRALRDRKVLPAADAGECRDNAAAMTCDLARASHSESQRTKDVAAMGQADRLYGACLAVFPDADADGETQYYAAELRWLRADSETDRHAQATRWEQAADAFTGVVDAGKVDAARLKESAYAAVLAWKNVLALEPATKAAPVALALDRDHDGKPPAAQPVPAREQKLLDAFERYRKSVRDASDPERVAITFLEGNLLRRYNQFDRALPLLVEIIERHPKHETAYYAANLVLDIHILTGRHDEVRRWAQWFRDHPAFINASKDQDRRDLLDRAVDIVGIADRIDGEDLEARAARTGDLGLYVQCGNKYLAIFNAAVAADPAAGVKDKLDEVLYNAGVCYELGRSLSAAISAFQELRERFPRSPTSAKALARLGAVYARVAYYQQASSMFEEYARTYAGQGDAYRAMNDAVFYRKGMGDDDRAIEDTRYFIDTFGGKQQGDAARAFFSLASIYEKRGDLDRVVRHYRDYLRRYGGKGGADKDVVAYARIGQVLWEQSCPVQAVDGACIEVTRERAVGTRAARTRTATRTRCGDDTKLKVTPIARDPRKVKAAMTAFAQTVKEYERHGGKTGGDDYQARRFYALARFDQAEVDYEAFLQLRFPGGLDFDPAKPAARAKSNTRLATWLADKKRLGEKATAAYGVLVFGIKDPTNAIAAAARMGQLSQNFADALYTAEIPAFLRPYDEAVDAYCDELTKVAEPYEATALDGFGACLEASTDLGWFSGWSRLCERELGQLRPEQFPTTSERWAEPASVTTISDLEPPTARLE